jgi:hypothetical protein
VGGVDLPATVRPRGKLGRPHSMRHQVQSSAPPTISSLPKVWMLSGHQQARHPRTIHGDSMLKILNKMTDSHTGRIAVTCCVVERNGNSTTTGSEETHGMTPEELSARYGGDPKLWLQSLNKEMKARHNARKAAAAVMQQLKEIEFIEDQKDEENHIGPEDQA